MRPFDWIAEDSAKRYIDRLRWIRGKPGVSPWFKQTVDALCETLALALERRTALSPGDVVFTAGMLRSGMEDEWLDLANPFSLGFGDERARTIVMGTEEANDPDDLALGNCGRAIVRLSGSSRPVFDALWAGHPKDPRGTPCWEAVTDLVHIRPMPFLRCLDVKINKNSTWGFLAQLMNCPMDDIGTRTYQIERSAVAAKLSRRGTPPDRDRREWLVAIMPGLAETARVLLIHGKTADCPNPAVESEWDRTNRELSCAFLDAKRLDAYRVASPHPRVFVFQRGKHTVILTGALSGRNRQIRDAFLPNLADVVASAGGYPVRTT